MSRRRRLDTQPGEPYPLGASFDGEGINFALFSENATGVELCLYDGPEGDVELARIDLTERTDLVWHVYVPRLAAGQRYAYRVLRGPRAIAVVPRLAMALQAEGWDDTTLALPPGRWRHELGGDEVSGEVLLRDLLARFPVALLSAA